MSLAKHIFTHCLVFFIGIVRPYNAVSQPTNLRFEKVNIADNPMFSNVDCIYEDSRGFMWFGTYVGLYMYDGYKLNHYENNPDDPLSISDNKITQIVEDEKGNFWVGTQNGVNYFDTQKHTFTRYNEVAKDGIGISWVSCIKKDDNNNIWVGLDSGLYFFDSKSGKFIQPYAQLKNSAIRNIEFGEQGFYVQTDKDLFLKNDKSNQFKLVYFPISDASKKDFRFALKLKYDNNTFFIKTNQGLFHVNQNINDTLAIKDSLFNNEDIRLILKKGKDELWVESNLGLSIFNTKTNSRQLFTYNPLNPESYPESKIYNASYTSSEILWIEAVNGTIYKVDMHYQQFQNVPIPLMNLIPSVNRLFELYEYSPNLLSMVR